MSAPFYRDAMRREVRVGDLVAWAPSGSSWLRPRVIMSIDYLEGKAPGHDLRVIACDPSDRERPGTWRQINPHATSLVTRGSDE